MPIPFLFSSFERPKKNDALILFPVLFPEKSLVIHSIAVLVFIAQPFQFENQAGSGISTAELSVSAWKIFHQAHDLLNFKRRKKETVQGVVCLSEVEHKEHDFIPEDKDELGQVSHC